MQFANTDPPGRRVGIVGPLAVPLQVCFPGLLLLYMLESYKSGRFLHRGRDIRSVSLLCYLEGKEG